MEGQVRQSSCLNLMLSMHPFPQTNFFPQLMLTLIHRVTSRKMVMTALLVSINISFYFDCYYNDVFMLSVGSALVLQKTM
jgi:hypothetical protein